MPALITLTHAAVKCNLRTENAPGRENPVKTVKKHI
jgi:hypothetical protein